MEAPNETKLIERAKEDAEAFGQLYDYYYPKIYGYTLKMVGNVADSEDIAALTFEKAIKALGQYSPERGSFSTWLYRIALNNTNDYYRSRGRAREVSIDDVSPALLFNSGAAAEKMEGYVSLVNAVGKLPRTYQAVLTLKFFENMNNDDIAAVLGCSKNALAVKVFRALKALEKVLDSEGIGFERVTDGA